MIGISSNFKRELWLDSTKTQASFEFAEVEKKKNVESRHQKHLIPPLKLVQIMQVPIFAS